jgi:hypothetical protein
MYIPTPPATDFEFVPINVYPEDSALKSKTNTTTGKAVLRLVNIQSLRKVRVISRTL